MTDKNTALALQPQQWRSSIERNDASTAIQTQGQVNLIVLINVSIFHTKCIAEAGILELTTPSPPGLPGFTIDNDNAL